MQQEVLKRLPEELRAQQDNARRVDALLQRSRAAWACDRRCAARLIWQPRQS